jgi:hypothetical protein
MMPQPGNEEEAKKVKRLRRFEEDAAQFKAKNTSASMQQIQLVKKKKKKKKNVLYEIHINIYY